MQTRLCIEILAWESEVIGDVLRADGGFAERVITGLPCDGLPVICQHCGRAKMIGMGKIYRCISCCVQVGIWPWLPTEQALQNTEISRVNNAVTVNIQVRTVGRFRDSKTPGGFEVLADCRYRSESALRPLCLI
ncbi:hypothetical protein A1332_17665 [Methylomonas methanica]|uniref:Uncharacterized protein n=1 Tax=Methylomonas methanica TaxID=421 RepID=A0A177M856_METMH|nr:hypothetical protein A1332_17665 [Methylomonas methanica]